MLYPGISLEDMLQGYREQYLQKKGWLCSVEKRASVDAQGEAVPWLTYPANAFLAQVVRPDFRVFEFGGGLSTVWWGRQAAAVYTVDHDESWLERIRPQCGANVTLRHHPHGAPFTTSPSGWVERFFAEFPASLSQEDPGFQLRAGLLSEPFRAYAAEILEFPSGHFDVVVIDGMARLLTTWLTVRHAQPKQFIVFDNSDREAYAPVYAFLKEAGYRRIDFWGTGPINPYEWCTSIFLRDLRALP